MSFSNGVFTINSTGQPVVAGTVISDTVFNAFTADIATGLSTCMLKDGTQVATAAIPFFAGTVSLPGIYLGTDTTTGLYRIAANQLGVAVSGALVAGVFAGGIKLGGTATRGTTEGTRHLDLFNGTAPVGTLANGATIYTVAGEMWVMNASGNATQLSGNPMNYAYQDGANASWAIKASAGQIGSVEISPNSSSGTITLYDNTAASGTIIGIFNITSTATIPANIDLKNAAFATGLTAVTTGSCRFTVTYQ